MIVLSLTREGKMSLIRAVVSVASIFLGLLAALSISMPQKAGAADQVINACKNNFNGDLKVVAQGTACPRNGPC
jgi:hypothetical protein